MLLHKYHPADGWLETSQEERVGLPYPHTLAEALYPEVQFAVISGVDTPEGWLLDTATGAKKVGDFIMSTEPISPDFWATAEESAAYGANLFTTCYAFPPEIHDLTILVVEDGEMGTGDCHGKASLTMWHTLGGDILTAGQFRLASSEDGVLAKGTLVVDNSVEGYKLTDWGIDLVLPQSCFKSSYKPELGIYRWECALGIVAWSQSLPTRWSWQVLQWFTWEAVEADLLPSVQVQAAALVDALADTRALAKLLRLDAREYELPVLDVIEADEGGLLAHHPYIVYRVGAMLRRRWLHLALGAGQRFTGLMALPDDQLPFGHVASRDLPVGDVIATRYPLRSWMDLRVWKSVGGSHIHQGVVYMSHETAAALGGDFDGDYFQFSPADEYPTLTAEIESWNSHTSIDKDKTRRASPLDQENLARVLMDNADSAVGRIAILIGRAVAAGKLGIVPQLAQQLQLSVDQFKFDVHVDVEWLAELHKQLPLIAWLRSRRNPSGYRTEPLAVSSNDTVGLLVRKVNAWWQPPQLMSGELADYKPLLDEPEKFMPQARIISRRYGPLVSAARDLKDKDERQKAMARIFVALKGWAEQVPEDERGDWAASLWHVAHNGSGTGSLGFVPFPQETAKLIGEAEVPDPDKVAIVGCTKNAYGPEDLEQFDGDVYTVKFALRPLTNGAGTKLRMAALVGDALLGFVSKETPTGQGVRRVQLTRSDAGDKLVVYAHA